MTEQLKECPCCGAKPRNPVKVGGSDERCGYNFVMWIECPCGLSIQKPSHQNKGGWCDDKGEALDAAVQAWNRRASQQVPEGLLDRIESARQRIESGHAPRRIPADPSDVDLVLAEVAMFLRGEGSPFWIAATAGGEAEKTE